MKKLWGILFCILMISGCGNSWEMTKKNYQSDYGELRREITIVNSFTGEIIWKYDGITYIQNSSEGDISILFYENGKPKKADFIGQGLIATIIEK